MLWNMKVRCAPKADIRNPLTSFPLQRRKMLQHPRAPEDRKSTRQVIQPHLERAQVLL